jgi:hypothetical protein
VIQTREVQYERTTSSPGETAADPYAEAMDAISQAKERLQAIKKGTVSQRIAQMQQQQAGDGRGQEVNNSSSGVGEQTRSKGQQQQQMAPQFKNQLAQKVAQQQQEMQGSKYAEHGLYIGRTGPQRKFAERKTCNFEAYYYIRISSTFVPCHKSSFTVDFYQ